MFEEKNRVRRLFWPRSIHLYHQKSNQARERVPLSGLEQILLLPLLEIIHRWQFKDQSRQRTGLLLLICIKKQRIANNFHNYRLFPTLLFATPAVRAPILQRNLYWNFRTMHGSYRNRIATGLPYRPASAGILEQSFGARNRVGIGLPYRTGPYIVGWRNRFLGVDSWAL